MFGRNLLPTGRFFGMAGGDVRPRANEQAQPIHTMRGAKLERRIDDILQLQDLNQKKAIFRSPEMKHFLGITPPRPDVERTGTRKLLRRTATRCVDESHTDDHKYRRRPELLATAALSLQEPAEVEKALHLLDGHLKQYRSHVGQSTGLRKQRKQDRENESAQKALALLLEKVAEVPGNFRDQIMNVVLDNVSALGTGRSVEAKIHAALERIDVANRASTPVEHRPGSRMARSLRGSFSTPDVISTRYVRNGSNTDGGASASTAPRPDSESDTRSVRTEPNRPGTPPAEMTPRMLGERKSASSLTRSGSATRSTGANAEVARYSSVPGGILSRNPSMSGRTTSPFDALTRTTTGGTRSSRPAPLVIPPRPSSSIMSASSAEAVPSLSTDDATVRSSSTSIRSILPAAQTVIPASLVPIAGLSEGLETFGPTEARALIQRLENDEWDNSEFTELLGKINAYLQHVQARDDTGEININVGLFLSYFNSASGLPREVADMRMLADAIRTHIDPSPSSLSEEQNELTQLQQTVRGALTERPSFLPLQGQPAAARIDTEALKVFMQQTDNIRTDARTLVTFERPAEVRPDVPGIPETGFLDQHYADSASQIQLFEKLFTKGENAPLAIISNEADLIAGNRSVAGKNNTCLIIALLQHATGDYDLTTHTAAASEIREEMENEFPDLKTRTTLLDADPSTDYTAWLLNKIESKYGKKLDLHVVQINEFGEPFFENPREAGSNPAILINEGAHFRALKLNNDQLDPQDGQRLAFEFVQEYTKRTFGARG